MYEPPTATSASALSAAPWFEILFLGGPADGPQFQDEPEDGDMMVEGVALAQLLEEYARQCSVSNGIVAAHSLDDVGTHPDFGSAAATLRWMLIHMVEETARHVGHVDAIRELLDGRVTITRSILLFLLAAVAEIGGAWLVWQGVRGHRGLLWIGPGVIGLGLFGFVAIGAGICLVGVAVIMYAPRPA